MSALEPVIFLGNFAVPTCTQRRLRRNSRGIDTGTLQYVTNSEISFLGGTPPPDDPHLRIDDIDTEQDCEGIWEHTLTVSGIAGPKNERHMHGSPDPKYSATDWDRVRINLITNNPGKYTEGQLVGGFGLAMICMEVNPKPLDDHSGWYELTADLQGIARNKQGTRQITATGKTLSGENVIWPLQPGWVTAHPGEIQIASVTVIDEFFSTSPPPTASVPGSRVPPNAPSIQVFNLNITEYREYWPNGWVFTPTAQQLVAGQSVYKHTWTYVWTPRFLTK